MTGHSPRTFPFVLVGNKAEDDLTHQRQVSAGCELHHEVASQLLHEIASQLHHEIASCER